jgi:hypothetical protein
MLMGLSACGYTSIKPEDRAAGFANTPDGPLVVEAHVELSEGVMMPMSHSTPIRIDAMEFRAWLAQGDSLREVKVPYRYRRAERDPSRVLSCWLMGRCSRSPAIPQCRCAGPMVCCAVPN